MNRFIPLQERKLYIPQMSYEGARCMAAAFGSIGVDAEPSPAGDSFTYDLARKYLSGDECLPEAVTLGNFLKITEQPDYVPEKTAFMLPTANGPCRYGHYLPLAKKIFKERGEDVLFVSPTSSNGYGGIGENAQSLVRTGWRAVVVSDILRKLLLLIRPYEREPGSTDKIFHTCLDNVCAVLATRSLSHSAKMKQLMDVLHKTRDLFRSIKVDKSREKIVIGIVGEIYCRFNNFSNNELFKYIEKHGGVVWVSDIAEWVHYTSNEEELRLIREGAKYSFQMFGCKIRQAVMHFDEQKMLSIFKKDFAGFEEPRHVLEILEKSRPYLPREGSNGEMVMSMGKTMWYYEKGAAGVIDISPFTCMNGIITEAVYPRVSRELNGFPIRVFYFDGNQTDVESDLEIFMELAQNYKRRRARV